MKMLGFGQAIGQIMQMAYVVEDIQAAIAWWMRDAKTGPWFLLPHFLGPDQFYQGAPSSADVAIAMAFAGHMQIELIQPLDDNPSVYRDGIAAHGFGFHHIGIACDDVEAEIPIYETNGYSLDFLAAVPTGGRVAYMRPPAGAAPGYVELIPASDGMDAHFTQFWRAAQNWDGKDSVRPFM